MCVLAIWRPTNSIHDSTRTLNAALSKLYGRAPVVSDSHLAGIVQDELHARGVEQVKIIPWNGRSLTEAFRGIKAHVLAESISFPDDRELFGALLRVRTRSRSGQPTIDLPRSTQSHCDMVAAIAAATYRLEKHGRVGKARTLSSFGRNYISAAVMEEALRGPPMMGMR